MKKILSLVTVLALVLALSASAFAADSKTVFKVGICNYVDDASLNQIVENIQNRLTAIGKEQSVTFDISYDNCNADANVMAQIIQNFIADDVDLMVGVATPVAMSMQAATEDNGIPVVFAAVSDPISTGIVESLEEPGANITGTSDGLDTAAVMKLIFAADPDADSIALLYDMGQDASTTPIAEAKAFLDEQKVSYKDYNGTTVDEVMLAVDALIADGVDAVFTPTDNTIMTAELSIYEILSEAVAMKQPPSDKGKRLRLYYITEVSVKPPTFVIFVNDKNLMHFSYLRYLENRLRDAFGFDGTALHFIVRQRKEDE